MKLSIRDIGELARPEPDALRKTNGVRKIACSICGKRLPVEQMVYSRHTGAYYCTDYEKHRRLLARARKRVGV